MRTIQNGNRTKTNSVKTLVGIEPKRFFQFFEKKNFLKKHRKYGRPGPYLPCSEGSFVCIMITRVYAYIYILLFIVLLLQCLKTFPDHPCTSVNHRSLVYLCSSVLLPASKNYGEIAVNANFDIAGVSRDRVLYLRPYNITWCFSIAKLI